MTPDQPLSEALLARLWAGQRFPESALVTTDGVRLRVLHPGIPGRGAGPDFRDAIIAARGRLLRGDVELHQRSSHFRAHGHGNDPRYGRLVLHVVFSDDAAEGIRLRAGARPVPVVALSSWLARRTEELSAWLASPSLWREPCHDALARLGGERVRETLATLGQRRFAEREASLAAALDVDRPGASLYAALLTGLGYGGERAAFEALPAVLPWHTLAATLTAAPDAERPLTAEAILLGAAGLLGEPAAPHERLLVETWQRLGRPSLPEHAGSRLPPARPANHPARRLAGLATLLIRHEQLFAGDGLLLEALQEPAARLIASWQVSGAGYWRDHIAPASAARRASGALIGRGRAIELLTNAVLPWAAALAERRGEAALAGAARAAFARLPSPARYGRLAFLETNLGLGREGPRLDARTQQGLLALYKTECTQGGCGRCPLS